MPKGLSNNSKESNIPKAFAGGFNPMNNPGGAAQGSKAVPLKAMPVNLGIAPPPKEFTAKAEPESLAN